MSKKNKLLDDNKAIIALEFAILLPILLVMILGTIEYCRAFYYQYKANKISSTLADAITISIPYYKPGGGSVSVQDCLDNKMIFTESRMNEIISAENVDVLASPLDTSKIFIRVSSIYQGYGNQPSSNDNTYHPDIQYTDTTSGAANLPFQLWSREFYYGSGYFSNSNSRPPELRKGGTFNQYDADLPAQYRDYNNASPSFSLFPGENIIRVEVYIKFDSIIGSGVLKQFISGYGNGLVGDVSYYSPRNYWLNSDNKPQGGLIGGPIINDTLIATGRRLPFDCLGTS